MNTRSLYRGHRLSAAILSEAVRWHFRFQLSVCDIEKQLFERSIVVRHATIRRRCDKFGAYFARHVNVVRRRPGGTWHLDEMVAALCREPLSAVARRRRSRAKLYVLFAKAVQQGRSQTLLAAVLRFCPIPCELFAEQLRSCSMAKADVAEFANVKHVFRQSSRTREQARRKQSSTPARAPHAQFPRARPYLRCFCRASARSGNISHSSDICWTHRFIENNSHSLRSWCKSTGRAQNPSTST